ncbi:hypothetical protein B0H11DRAFT_22194 [Mycena galericulata]|nr:hypothetical protein B0H11DRAFT_22194 [Mycena galericulata]
MRLLWRECDQRALVVVDFITVAPADGAGTMLFSTTYNIDRPDFSRQDCLQLAGCERLGSRPTSPLAGVVRTIRLSIHPPRHPCVTSCLHDARSQSWVPPHTRTHHLSLREGHAAQPMVVNCYLCSRFRFTRWALLQYIRFRRLGPRLTRERLLDSIFTSLPPSLKFITLLVWDNCCNLPSSFTCIHVLSRFPHESRLCATWPRSHGVKAGRLQSCQRRHPSCDMHRHLVAVLARCGINGPANC